MKISMSALEVAKYQETMEVYADALRAKGLEVPPMDIASLLKEVKNTNGVSLGFNAKLELVLDIKPDFSIDLLNAYQPLLVHLVHMFFGLKDIMTNAMVEIGAVAEKWSVPVEEEQSA